MPCPRYIGDLAFPETFSTGAPLVKLNGEERVAVASSSGVKNEEMWVGIRVY